MGRDLTLKSTPSHRVQENPLTSQHYMQIESNGNKHNPDIYIVGDNDYIFAPSALSVIIQLECVLMKARSDIG